MGRPPSSWQVLCPLSRVCVFHAHGAESPDSQVFPQDYVLTMGPRTVRASSSTQSRSRRC